MVRYDKYQCILCLTHVDKSFTFNCAQCKQCKRYMHRACLFRYSNLSYNSIKKDERLLKDDIIICPICHTDGIIYCDEPLIDMNKEIKDAVSIDPNRKGGKRKNHKKSKKSIKNRRSRKTRKTRK